ncbi:MAG: WG repeat-containing protein [Geobacteraceae bacterium]
MSCLSDFSEGLGRVKSVEGKWGFVGRNGAVAIKPRFDSAGPFEDGLAQVELAGKKGYIDRSGKFVWGPEED